MKYFLLFFMRFSNRLKMNRFNLNILFICVIRIFRFYCKYSSNLCRFTFRFTCQRDKLCDLFLSVAENIRYKSLFLHGRSYIAFFGNTRTEFDGRWC